MNGLNNILQMNMHNYLYPFFWQHGNSHEIPEYMDKIAEAGMKGLCIEARPHPEFLGEGWWRDLDLILSKAKEHDMKLWILDDSHFPTGYANGKVKECFPQHLKWYLDMRRYDVHGPAIQARIDFKLLKGHVWEKPDDSAKILGVYLAKRSIQETVQGDLIDADTLTDITNQMRMNDHLLTLDVPDGAYSIFVVFMTRKGMEDATKDYLNPLVKEATQVLIQEVYESHFAHYRDEFGKTIQGFFSDEPRFGNFKGTKGWIGREDMPLPWRDGLEQEIEFDKKYFPLLWVSAGGMESTIRFQYMDIVTRLYNENFTKVLGNWCQTHGVWYLGHTIEDNGAHARLGYGTGHYFRGQQDMDVAGIDVIGGQIVPGMNYHHDAFNTGGSNGEFYHYALAKLASSAAHLDSKKGGRAMCEAFGAYGWNEGLKTMKWIADHLIVRGINYIVPHAFDTKDFPDWDCPPHFYAHGHNPQFRYFKVFSDYVNRIMGLFRDGMHPAKVGLFYPAETEWAGAYMPVEKPARELTIHQIPFDIVSRDYLKMAKIETGEYVINGERLKVLVFPYGECIPTDIVPILCEMAASEIEIIFINDVPLRTVGTKVQSFLSDIITQCSVVNLKELGTKLSRFRAVKLDKNETDLVVGVYERDEKRFFMFFNENVGTAIHAKAFLDTKGYIYCYDAITDTLYTTRNEDGYIKLDLEPYESTIFVVSKKPMKAEKNRIMDNTGWTTVPLPEKWKVSFADSFSYPEFQEIVPTNQLGFIHQFEGWENKAGTVRFTASFEVSESKILDAILNLGEVHETAEVFINKTSAGVRLCKPYVFELGHLLKPGKNELSIEVTNTLGTAVREPLSHYLVIEPFGVQGPVKLEIKNKKED